MPVSFTEMNPVYSLFSIQGQVPQTNCFVHLHDIRPKYCGVQMVICGEEIQFLHCIRLVFRDSVIAALLNSLQISQKK